MSYYFFDTSAIVKYYVEEPGSEWVESCDQQQLEAARGEGIAADSPFDHLAPSDRPTA